MGIGPRESVSRGRRPAMRQQFRDPAGRLRRQSLQHVAQVGIQVKPIELGRVDQAHHGRSQLARAQTAGEQQVLPPQRDGTDAVLRPIGVDGQLAVVEVSGQRRPAL